MYDFVRCDKVYVRTVHEYKLVDTIFIISGHRMETLTSKRLFLLIGHLMASFMRNTAVLQQSTTNRLLLAPLATFHLSLEPAAETIRAHRAVALVQQDMA